MLSDNGSAYISGQLADYLREANIQHTRGKPYHPMTQGKIERYHRSLKNLICLDHYYFLGQLEEAIADFVKHYNHLRYHEALDNLTPADVYFGRKTQVLSQREEVKLRTLSHYRAHYLAARSSA